MSHHDQRVPPFDAEQLEEITHALTDSDDGLTTSEIQCILQDCRIPDVSPDMSRWERLLRAFVQVQEEHNARDPVVAFIDRAMNPASHKESSVTSPKTKARMNAILDAEAMRQFTSKTQKKEVAQSKPPLFGNSRKHGGFCTLLPTTREADLDFACIRTSTTS